MKLYGAERSGNAYKVRLLLSLLDICYEKIAIDLAKREQKQARYLKLSPRGQVPALEDEGRVMEDHLGTHHWLTLDRMTIADIACFPYVALAPDANIPLDEYAAIRAWIGRMQALPGYVPLPMVRTS